MPNLIWCFCHAASRPLRLTLRLPFRVCVCRVLSYPNWVYVGSVEPTAAQGAVEFFVDLSVWLWRLLVYRNQLVGGGCATADDDNVVVRVLAGLCCRLLCICILLQQWPGVETGIVAVPRPLWVTFILLVIGRWARRCALRRLLFFSLAMPLAPRVAVAA